MSRHLQSFDMAHCPFCSRCGEGLQPGAKYGDSNLGKDYRAVCFSSIPKLNLHFFMNECWKLLYSMLLKHVRLGRNVLGVNASD